MISSLLFALPIHRKYRVLFLLRPIEEVVRSQAAMIERLGTKGPAVGESMMAAALKAHLAQVSAWLDRQAHIEARRVDYHEVLRSPMQQAEEVARFLDMPLDTEAMARQVDVSLYRAKVV